LLEVHRSLAAKALEHVAQALEIGSVRLWGHAGDSVIVGGWYIATTLAIRIEDT
jgi:hypothetical protein